MEGTPSPATTCLPPSKYMRLGSGLSNRVKSAALSCFDLELYAETIVAEPRVMSESDLSELFGLSVPDKQCSKKTQSWPDFAIYSDFLNWRTTIEQLSMISPSISSSTVPSRSSGAKYKRLKLSSFNGIRCSPRKLLDIIGGEFTSGPCFTQATVIGSTFNGVQWRFKSDDEHISIENGSIDRACFTCYLKARSST